MIEDSARVEAAENLLREVGCIARNPVVVSSVPEIGLLLTFLREVGLVILVPERDGAVFGRSSKYPYFSSFFKEQPDNASILLYPMFLQDASISKVCEYYTQAVGYASYGPVSNCIAVNMDSKETLRMLACSFLHELGHAQAAHCEGRIGQPQTRSEEERLYEETAVWTLEYKLMLALGGPKYLNAVGDLVRSICEYWQGQTTDVLLEGRGRALDCCFGVSPSPNAEQERDKTFFAYCQLMAADIFFPEGSRIAAKVEMMKTAQTR